MGAYVPTGNLTSDITAGVKRFATGVKEGMKGLASDVKQVNAPPSPKKPAPPVIKDVGSYRSLADLQTHGYAKDAKTAQVAAARQLKDPTQAPTATLQLQAASGKLQRLTESRAYQSLRPENKLKIKGEFYDKFIAPALKRNGIEPPDRESWLEGYGKAPEEQFPEDRPKSSAIGIAASAYYGGSSAALNAINNFVYGVAKYPFKPTSGLYKKLEAEQHHDFLAKAADLYSQVNTDYDGAFESRHDSAAWLANFGGHLLGESPAYAVAGATGEALVPSLAEVSALSKGAKIGISALKNASEVYLVDKAEQSPDALKEGAFAGALSILFPVLKGTAGSLFTGLLRFKAAQLATGGNPFVRKIIRLADEHMYPEGTTGVPPPPPPGGGGAAPPPTPSPKPTGAEALINPKDPAVQNVVAAERKMREELARQHYPQKAEAAGEKSVWRNLSKEQRQKIKDHIEAANVKASELMPIIQPEIQTAANQNELAKEMAANPLFKERLQKYAQVTGVDPAQAVTLSQAKKAARANNLDNPVHQLQDILHSEAIARGEGDPLGLGIGMGGRAFKGRSTLPAAAMAASPTMKGFLTTTRKFLNANPITKSGKDHFPNPQHQLLWLFGYSDAPQAIKIKAYNYLKKDFKMSPNEIDNAAGWVGQHYNDIVETGALHDPKYGGRFFKDTKATQRRFGTETQRKLYEEDIPQHDLKQVRALLRTKPELKASVSSLLTELTTLRNKAATPATSARRRELTRNVRDILARYKDK